MRYTKYLNPSQTAVSCSDQPLYALKKVIQCSYPEIFLEKDFFAFLGPLHIEQAALSAHGQLIRGTVLDNIIDNSVLTTKGLETALCDANSIKKARYTIQVVSCVLYKLLLGAFEETAGSEEMFEAWLLRIEGNTSFKYWCKVLELEKNIRLLVRCSSYHLFSTLLR